jgi:hypothetical protein
MSSLAALPHPCPDDCLACWLRREPASHCKGSFELVELWVYDRATVLDDLIDLLESRGGFCDCEVLLNALDASRLVFGDLVLACGAAGP